MSGRLVGKSPRKLAVWLGVVAALREYFARRQPDRDDRGHDQHFNERETAPRAYAMEAARRRDVAGLQRAADQVADGGGDVLVVVHDDYK